VAERSKHTMFTQVLDYSNRGFEPRRRRKPVSLRRDRKVVSLSAYDRKVRHTCSNRRVDELTSH
jgi:hypothetical protein